MLPLLASYKNNDLVLALFWWWTLLICHFV